MAFLRAWFQNNFMHAKSRQAATTGTHSVPPKWIQREEPISKYRPGGYHPISIGDKLDNERFEIARKLGWGQYATVWAAFDSKHRAHVALKILRSDITVDRRFKEEEILGKVQARSECHPDRRHITTMLHHFRHRGPNGEHLCIAFELLGPTLTAYRESRGGYLPMEEVKAVAVQVLETLDFLQRCCEILHADIKPTNLMLVYPDPEGALRKEIRDKPPVVYPIQEQRTGVPPFLIRTQPLPLIRLFGDGEQSERFRPRVKIGDFGAAITLEDLPLVPHIEPLGLRAPEVILQSGFGAPAEIWGLALVLWNLATGEVIIDQRFAEEHAVTEEEEVLAQITMLFGAVPAEMISQGKRGQEFYKQDGETWSFRNMKVLCEDSLREFAERYPPPNVSATEMDSFLKFLERALRLHPHDRASPKQLLKDEWLAEVASLKSCD